jgi:hypothetical protein
MPARSARAIPWHRGPGHWPGPLPTTAYTPGHSDGDRLGRRPAHGLGRRPLPVRLTGRLPLPSSPPPSPLSAGLPVEGEGEDGEDVALRVEGHGLHRDPLRGRVEELPVAHVPHQLRRLVPLPRVRQGASLGTLSLLRLSRSKPARIQYTRFAAQSPHPRPPSLRAPAPRTIVGIPEASPARVTRPRSSGACTGP